MTVLRVGRHVLDAECERPRATSGGLHLEGVARFEGTRTERCEVARQHLRDLLSYEGTSVAVSSEEFPEIDGYYQMATVNLRVDSPFPVAPFSSDLLRIGTADDLRFESRLIGAVATNDFSIVDAEPMHAPPIGHTGYDPRHVTSTTRLIAFEDPITVYYDLPFVTSRLWAVDADDFYRGAVTVSRRDSILPEYGPISGTTMQIQELDEIQLDNGIVRFFYRSDAWYVGFWDGTAWRDKAILFAVEGTTMHTWRYVAILDNRPEKCVLRFEGGLAARPVMLTVALKRGARGVACRLSADASNVMGVFDAALTDMTITSNRALYTAADSNGHKLLFVSLKSFSSDPPNGFIYKSAATFDVYIGMQLSGAGAGNTAAALALQYEAAGSESMRAVRR